MSQHVVVDGSNLATEGRTHPSLKQLNEAVLAYMAEEPEALITVVVDATFGHRIDAKEVAEFDEAVSNNELVAPPAGAIGRGDAFVLSIANKVHANILSNDSYQEFHGHYDWLFDEGRLIGGKPVPHIGWVFVNRLPVRGPLSRKSVADSKRKGGRSRAGASDATVRVGSPDASLPMPVPKTPPPGAAARKTAAADAAAPKSRRSGRGGAVSASAAADPVAEVASQSQQAPKSSVNELLSFLTFIERHPAGTSVNAIVDHYSSHGAYVRIGDMIGYVPLRLMAHPAPRSAREFMKVGESVTLVVESFVPTKRSVDLAVPGMGTAEPLGAAVDKPVKTKATKSTPAKKAAAKKAVARKAVARKATTSTKSATAKKPATAKADTTEAVVKKAVKKRTAAAPVAALDTPSAAAAPVKKATKLVSPAKAAAPAQKTAEKKTQKSPRKSAAPSEKSSGRRARTSG